MDNVIKFNGVTKLDLPPDQILEAAVGKVESVLVIGYDKDGKHYFASSVADGAEVLWLVEQFKKALLGITGDGS